MKRLLIALSLALLVSASLSVSAASASHSNGVGPNKDLVSGTVKVSQLLTESDTGITFTRHTYVHFNAQSDPTGENPRGHFIVRLNDTGGSRPFHFDAAGEVVCFQVRDHAAVVIGEADRNKGQDRLQNFIIFITDNGEGNDPNDTRGVAVFFIGSEPLPRPDEEGCRRVGDFLEQVPGLATGGAFDQGNFIVHDAKP